MVHKPAHLTEYSLEFTDAQWEELVSLTFEPFEFFQGDSLTRGQWMALAEMCLGKAQRIEEGNYHIDDDDDGCDFVKWAEDLRVIASEIFAFFQPADGKL